MKTSTMLGLSPFLGFLVLAVWAGALRLAGDPRVSDGRLAAMEMSSLESLLFVYVLFSVVIAWLVSVVRALRAKRFGWVAAMLILWPVTPVFIWSERKSRSRPPENNAQAVT